MSGSDHHKKYSDGMKNPLTGKFLNRFIQLINQSIVHFSPNTILDAGCGDGTLIQYLIDSIPHAYTGVDADEDAIKKARNQYPQFSFSRENIYSLPFDNKSHDLVICLEVLEHLETPNKALAELTRVARNGLIVSVPWEPWFQLGNLARGKHFQKLGNHPEHVQHWNRKTFGSFLRQNSPPNTRIRIVPGSWPWIIAILEY